MSSKHTLPQVSRKLSPVHLKKSHIVLGGLLPALSGLFPLLLLWSENQGEVPFIQVLVPAAAEMLVGLLIYFILLLITRRPFFCGLFSALSIFLIVDFQFIRGLAKLAPVGEAEPIVSALLLVIILTAAFFLLNKFAKSAVLKRLNALLSVAMAIIILLSIVLGIPSSSETSPEPKESSVVNISLPSFAPLDTPTPEPVPNTSESVVDAQPTETLKPVLTLPPSTVRVSNPSAAVPQFVLSEKLPNVYFFLLDEYSPGYITSKYFGFDNSFFKKFLTERNFNISESSVVNYPDTSFCVGELNRLVAYEKPVSAGTARNARKNDAPLFEAFRAAGYEKLYRNNTNKKMFNVTSIDKAEWAPLSDIPPVKTPEPSVTPIPNEADSPTSLPSPTPLPEPTPIPTKSGYFDDLDLDDANIPWVDRFFTATTFGGMTVFDLAINMSVLSLFIAPKTDIDFDDDDIDDDDDINENIETAPTPTPLPTAEPTNAALPEKTPEPTTTVDTKETEALIDDDDDDYDDEDFPAGEHLGELVGLNEDAPKDPVPYDQLIPPTGKQPYRAPAMFRTLATLERFTSEGFAQPTVFFNYFRQPHGPLLFYADGRPMPRGLWYGWRNPNIYLGQLKYITTQMMHVVEVLQKSDPDCVIIIQSDHGLRYKFLTKSYTTGVIDREDMHYVLNCVYYRGQTVNIEGLSPINTLRTIFTQLGYPMPLTRDPRALAFRGQEYGIPDDDPRVPKAIDN